MRNFDKKNQIKIIKIIFIIIWMTIIFIFSSQQGTESGNTSRIFTVKLIKSISGINLEIDDPFVEKIQFVIRKMAHFTVYSIGGFLIMNYTYTTKGNNIKKKIFYSIIFGASYAVTDEIHQFFVPGRSAKILDVGIDTAGVITGIFIYLALKKIIKIIVNKRKQK